MRGGSHFTRGGQITFHYWTMLFQIIRKTGKLAVVLIMVLTVLGSALLLDRQTLMGTWYYWSYKVQHALFLPADRVVYTVWDGRVYEHTLGHMAHHPLLAAAHQTFWLKVQVALFGSVGLGIALLLLSVVFFRRQGNDQTEDKFVSGRRIAEPAQLAAELKQHRCQSDFVFAGHRIFTRDFEVQHVLLSGTTGTGKTVAIRKFLQWIRARGDKAIVYDKGCTFVGQFYQAEADILLNPFDDRCAHWDVWCDATDAMDFENMADALIPLYREGDPFWVQSARAVFTSTAFKLKDDPHRSTEKLLEWLLTAELEDLNQYLEGTESAALTSERMHKTALSIKSVLAAYVKSLRFLEGLDAKGADGRLLRKTVSIRDWVQDDQQKGFLFLSSNAQQHASLRPLISLWLSIASTAILGMAENRHRRIWVIMDEMPSLHKLPALPATIAEARKFGGCYVVGIQSPAQLSETYGDKAAKVLLDLLNTCIFFRAPSKSMAKIASDELGEQEFKVTTENTSYGAHAIRDGVSLTWQTVTRPAVKPDNLMTLDSLRCWFRPIGAYPITQLQLRYDQLPSLCTPFKKRVMASSERMEKINSLLAFMQVGMLDQLPDAIKRQLLSLFDRQYESSDERHQDVDFLKENVKEAPERWLDQSALTEQESLFEQHSVQEQEKAREAIAQQRIVGEAGIELDK